MLIDYEALLEEALELEEQALRLLEELRVLTKKREECIIGE